MLVYIKASQAVEFVKNNFNRQIFVFAFLFIRTTIEFASFFFLYIGIEGDVEIILGTHTQTDSLRVIVSTHIERLAHIRREQPLNHMELIEQHT